VIGRRTIGLTLGAAAIGGAVWFVVDVLRAVNSLGLGHELIPYAERGNVQKVRENARRGAHVNMLNSMALRLAAQNGHEEVVTVLLDAGAWVNSTPYARETPLTAAVIGGKTAVVKLLLSRGADPNLRDVDGKLPLVVAARNGRREIVRLLLDAGADPNAAAGSVTPHQAARGRPAIQQLLKDGGATR
jgi:ankyrin repeat protein